jgi:hypothetical protein
VKVICSDPSNAEFDVRPLVLLSRKVIRVKLELVMDAAEPVFEVIPLLDFKYLRARVFGRL